MGIFSLRLQDVANQIKNVGIIIRPQFKKKSKNFYLFNHFVFGSDTLIRGENPSGSCNGSARGMARLASAMSNQGLMPDGRILMQKETWRSMHSDARMSKDALICRQIF